MFYTPNDHDGVNKLMESLRIAYPQVKTVGLADTSELEYEYAANLFDLWVAVDFHLTDDQISTGLLVTSEIEISNVNYEIRVCPSQMVCFRKKEKCVPLFIDKIYSYSRVYQMNQWMRTFIQILLL